MSDWQNCIPDNTYGLHCAISGKVEYRICAGILFGGALEAAPRANAVRGRLPSLSMVAAPSAARQRPIQKLQAILPPEGLLIVDIPRRTEHLAFDCILGILDELLPRGLAVRDQ